MHEVVLFATVFSSEQIQMRNIGNTARPSMLQSISIGNTGYENRGIEVVVKRAILWSDTHVPEKNKRWYTANDTPIRA
jgi:hypothetical protein